MDTKLTYSRDEMKELIRQMSRLFDVVRLVDPIAMLVYEIKDDKFIQQQYNCFHVWKRNERCENCVSARSHMLKGRCTKFEFIGLWKHGNKYIDNDEYGEHHGGRYK